MQYFLRLQPLFDSSGMEWNLVACAVVFIIMFSARCTQRSVFEPALPGSLGKTLGNTWKLVSDEPLAPNKK